jgi:glucose/arabinose dehydrogenase
LTATAGRAAIVIHRTTAGGSLRPKSRRARHQFPQAIHESGVAVYRGRLLPQLRDNLLIGSADGRGLLRVRPEHDRRRPSQADEWLLRGAIDSIRTLGAATDGTIYLATADALVRVDAQPDR